jgi:hypothetical protein
MNRYTFVVRIHPGGVSTLENLTTYERVKLTELATVGPQIERWLSEQSDSSAAASTTEEIQ